MGVVQFEREHPICLRGVLVILEIYILGQHASTFWSCCVEQDVTMVTYEFPEMALIPLTCPVGLLVLKQDDRV